MDFENLRITSDDDDDFKVVENLNHTFSYIEELMAKRPLMICKLEQNLNKLHRMVIETDGRVRNSKAKEKVYSLFHQLATLRLDPFVEKEGDAEKNEKRRLKMIEETSSEDYDWAAKSDKNPQMFTLASIPPMQPVIEPPELFSYDEVQIRIDMGFTRIETLNLKFELSYDLQQLISLLAKSSFLLVYLNPKTADAHLRAIFKKSIINRTLSRLPSHLSQNFKQATVMSSSDDYKQGNDDEEETDLNEKLKQLQDFLCKQLVIEYFASVKVERNSDQVVCTGDAMVDDKQYRQLNTCVKYPTAKYPLFSEVFPSCPFCHLVDHRLLKDCNLKKMIICFKCFDYGHGKKYCPNTKIRPENLIF